MTNNLNKVLLQSEPTTPAETTVQCFPVIDFTIAFTETDSLKGCFDLIQLSVARN